MNTLSFKKIKPSYIIIIIISFIVMIILINESIKPWLAEFHYRAGYNEFARRRYLFAIEELELAKKYAPWETHYQLTLAKSYNSYADQQKIEQEKLKYINESINVYKNMERLDPQNPWYKNSLAMMTTKLANLNSATPEEKRKLTERALNYTRLAAELDAQNPIFQLNYAFFLHQHGVRLNDKNIMKKAIPFYKKVYEYDDRMIESLYNLGDVYRRLGNWDETLKNYLIVYEKNPNFQNIKTALGGVYITLNKLKEAIPYLEEALIQKPKSFEILSNLASIHYKNENWQRCIELYKDIFNYFPEKKEFHPLYIQVLLRLNQPNYAVIELEDFLKKYPNNKTAKTQLRQLKKALRGQR